MSIRNIKKIMLIGQKKTGKTSIIHYLLKNRQFQSEHYPSVGVEAGIKTIQFNNQENTKDKQFAIVQYWDTTGNHEFHSLVCEKFYDQMDGFVIVTDLTDSNTLNSVNYWYKKIKQIRKSDQGYLIGVVASKSDTPNPQFTCEDFLRKYDKDSNFIKPKIKFYGTFSLKEKIENNQKPKVQEIFQQIIKDFYQGRLPTVNIAVQNQGVQSPCNCTVM